MTAVSALSIFPLFDHFAVEQLESLAACISRVRFPAESRVLAEGERSTDAFVIVEGRIRVERETPYGLFQLALLEPGEMFGEVSFLDQEARSVDAVAEIDTELFLINPMALAALAERDQKFELALYWTLWRNLSLKLRKTNQRLTRFFSETGTAGDSAPTGIDEPTGSFQLDLATKRDLFREQKLSDMEINFLSSLSQEKKYHPNEVLFREGDIGDSMYIVLDGKVRITKNIPGAGEEALAFMERGDYFGEMSLIDELPRSAEAKAHDRGAVVLRIPKDVVSGLLDINKVSSLRLLRILCTLIAKRLREIDDKLVGWFILAGGQGGSLGE
jgi:CRP-like cAMP-binding protein